MVFIIIFLHALGDGFLLIPVLNLFYFPIFMFWPAFCEVNDVYELFKLYCPGPTN